MSEASEKVRGLKHLPVFPLPLVLLPDEILPLHIFEPRYRQMLEDIALEKNLFGVSFSNPTESFIEKPAAGTVGCVAEVREVQSLPDGRSNILTVGVVRYRLIEYVDAGEPYSVGELEFFEDEADDAEILEPLADEVFRLFRRVAEAAHKSGDARGALPEIEQTQPQNLSFLIAAAFNLAPDLKYEMLETRSTVKRLTKLREILRRAAGKMEQSADIRKIAGGNGHAKKKINL